MTNKSFFIISFLLLTAVFSIFTTYSFFSFNTIEFETVNRLGEWNPADTKLNIFKDQGEYFIEELITDENKTNLIHVISPQQNQYFSFEYKINSQETALGFDNPNLFVKVDDEVVLQTNRDAAEWQREFINLSKYEGAEIEIELVSQNTVDDLFTPQLEVRDVSTAKYLAKQNDRLVFEISKENTSVFVKYKTEVEGNILEHDKELIDQYEFIIDEHYLSSELEYYSIDSYGNVEESRFVNVYTDFIAPESVDGFRAYSEGDGEVSFVFNSPSDNYSGSTKEYDLRTSDSMEHLNTNWDQIEKLTLNNHRKFGYANLPQTAENLENILIKNGKTGSQNFAIKSIDQAGNYSEISEIIEIKL